MLLDSICYQLSHKMEDIIKITELIIHKNEIGKWLDRFLFDMFPLCPKSLLYKAIRTKNIKLNNKRCMISERVRLNDHIQIYLHDDILIPKKPFFIAAPPTLSIIYEDDNLMLLDKPVGLLVHGDNSRTPDTLINRALNYLYEKGEYNPSDNGAFTPALCNRIDRNTGGIVILAKTVQAFQILNRKIRQREVRKFYLCLIYGVPVLEQAVLTGYHVKEANSNRVKIFSHPAPGSKTILTSYRVLRSSENISLLEVELLTGRTYQIRAHMASIGHPLIGDSKYGHIDVRQQNEQSQALYSYKIIFDFKTNANELNYLNRKVFQVHNVPFRDII